MYLSHGFLLSTIGFADNNFTGGLTALAGIWYGCADQVVYLRSQSGHGFSGVVPALPAQLGALFLDGNADLSYLDMVSICKLVTPMGGRSWCPFFLWV
jgi:hypothetical protein